ncbi:hypothetical protein L873DRAFT_1104647 [Choiromyces venosus 120613-1]|uniref:Uncharacterized protein n=1 Tax=Choiromyces venosus 120613-1 TaxID=1336337 RepID=A0A3N4JHF3_9PEZI|nr:hypothetical protein L873DRAFT_1104647 [Choiromyces venosus 120613-1]
MSPPDLPSFAAKKNSCHQSPKVACLGVSQGFRICVTTPRLPGYAGQKFRGVGGDFWGSKPFPTKWEGEDTPRIGIAWGLPRTYDDCLGEIKNSTPRSYVPNGGSGSLKRASGTIAKKNERLSESCSCLYWAVSIRKVWTRASRGSSNRKL